MPRQLSTKPNGVRFFDPKCEDWITLYYRTPTTEERNKFMNSMFSRKGSKVEIASADLDYYGKLILTGFQEGCYTDEENKLFSSDPKSSVYRADWKEFIADMAPEHIAFLANHAFNITFATEKIGETTTGANPS